jgi:ribosome modulation factor
MLVRNTHPNRPLMCSGYHLQPGVWTEVPDSFAVSHTGVPDLEFGALEPQPGILSKESFDLTVTAAGDELEEDFGPTSAGDELEVPAITDHIEQLPRLEVAETKQQYTLPANEELVADASPYVRGEFAALHGEPEGSCPFSDKRTRNAKEWLRGHRAGREALDAMSSRVVLVPRRPDASTVFDPKE